MNFAAHSTLLAGMKNGEYGIKVKYKIFLRAKTVFHKLHDLLKMFSHSRFASYRVCTSISNSLMNKLKDRLLLLSALVWPSTGMRSFAKPNHCHIWC